MDETLFLESTYRIINKYNAKTKQPRYYGELLLYSSEVHMLEVIGGSDGITATQIAANMAITKGAVSQTTSKLLKKGLIEKRLAGDSANTILIFLTEAGQSVYTEHRRLHQAMLSRITDALNQMPQETQQQILSLMDIVDSSLDNY